MMYADLLLGPPGTGRLAWTGPANDLVGAVSTAATIPVVLGLRTLSVWTRGLRVLAVLVAVVAWAALGERPGWRTLASIPIVFSGGVLISGVVGSGAYGDDPLVGVIYGVWTAIA